MKIRRIIAYAFLLTIVLLFVSCGNNYDDVRSQLNGRTWYYNGGTDTEVNSITFSTNAATIAQTVRLDWGGRTAGEGKEYEFSIDDKKITIPMDESEMTIPYSFDGEVLKLGSGDYLTAEEVDDAIQGYWTTGLLVKTNQDFTYISQNDILFDKGAVTWSSAGSSSLTPDVFYPKKDGPYSYTIGFGRIESEMPNSLSWEWDIIGGKPIIKYIEDTCERSDGFPTQDEYDEILYPGLHP